MFEIGDLVRIRPELIGGDQIICLVIKVKYGEVDFCNHLIIQSISDRQIYYVGESQVEVLNGDSFKNRNPE